MGRFWEMDLDKIDKKAFCKQCNCECFRDPSELLGNLLDLYRKPISTVNRFIKDKEYTNLLTRDFKYYKACDFFNGRMAPNYDKHASKTSHGDEKFAVHKV